MTSNNHHQFQATSRRAFLQTSLAAAATAGLLPAATHSNHLRKKGIGMTLKNPAKIQTLKKLKAEWLYTWGTELPPNLPPTTNFVPMIWGYWGQDNHIRQTGEAAQKAGIKELLGFNEPDQKQQSNISVEKALKKWPLLMETELRLGSPACVHPDREWMKQFMPAAKRKGLRVDFVCVHSYGGTDSEVFLKRMEKIHRLFGKPLWITEFAVGDWNAKSPQQNRHKPEAVLRFMEKVLPALEKRDYVEKYAWFPASPTNNALGTSALYKPNGELTKLGKFYRDFH